MYLQLTSRNAIVSYQSVGTGGAVPNPTILQGWAEDNFMTLDITDNVEMKKSLDNITIGWVKPVVMSGRLMVLPNSPAQQTLLQVQTFQTISGIISPGILTITYPSLLASVVYQNFTIKSAFSGYPIGEKVGNCEITFGAEIPNASTINSLIQLGLASIGSF